MKSKLKSKEDCIKLLLVEIPHEFVKKTSDEIYEEISKVAKVPGFRPGAVPRDLLEKHYSKNAEEEIFKKLIPEGYKKALDTHKLTPIGMPRISNIKLEDGKPLTFEAEVDIRPATKLKNYKGIRVSKKRLAVTDEEINQAILKIRDMHAKHKDIPGPVKKGDYAVCDVEAFIDGKLISKKHKNMWVLAEKDASLLGMGEELVGLEKGKEKEVEAKLPDNYPDKKYAGKLAKFKILVNQIKEKELPEVNDELAKEMKSENLEELKKNIKSQLLLRKERSLVINMQNQILENLLKGNRFSVPSGIVERQKHVLAKRLETELLQNGMHKDEVEKKLKEFDGKLSEEATDKVRIYFLLDDIAVKEKITVNDKDIEGRLKSIAFSAGRPEEEVRKYYENEGLIEGLAEEIKEGKALDLLLKEAQVIEEK